MKIGIPKEIKNHEYRVGATPSFVSMLTRAEHTVMVQEDAGAACGYSNEMYAQAGAQIVGSLEEIYKAEMVLKVKELQSKEFPLVREGQIIFCFLHLAAEPEVLKHLVERKAVGISFDTVTDAQGRLPLLTPMSEVAGRMAIQAGAWGLQMANGGKGLLLGGVPGVPPAKVIVLGGGVVGTQAARMAVGFGADVTILERRLDRLRELDDLYAPKLKTLYSTPVAIEEALTTADLVIGAVLIPGARTPKLVTKEMLKLMQKGSVLVDVAIDQGGCFETSHVTTHSDPIYTVDGVVHYCVGNMPGACARTSTQALTNAVIPYAMEIAEKGYKRAAQEFVGIKEGINTCMGAVTNEAVARDCGYDYTPADQFIT